MEREDVADKRVTRLPDRELMFHTLPYKAWRDVYMRNKKLARLG